MQPELKPVRTDNKGFGRGTSYEPVQDVAYSFRGGPEGPAQHLHAARPDHGADGDRRLHRHGDEQRHHGEPDHQLAGDAGAW